MINFGKNCAIVGYTGFVGSNLVDKINFSRRFNSKNIEEIKSLEFDTIVFCGAKAEKWKANLQPEEDLRHIKSLVSILSEVKTKNFILISTVDVYPSLQQVDERSVIDFELNHAYGSNRSYLESFCRSHFASTIIRLPALFGKNIKKNAIFDLLNENQVEKINPQNEYQFYYLERFASDIERILNNNIKLINIVSEPISMEEVAECLGCRKLSPLLKAPIKYDIQTNYSNIWNKKGRYSYSKNEILSDLRHFLDWYNQSGIK